jgi:acyl-coenzyme A synthetase/AMP-(fatty) acid ligase
MLAVEDAGTRYPQAFRRVCSAGEPLKPEAIRWFREQYGLTVLGRCRAQFSPVDAFAVAAQWC